MTTTHGGELVARTLAAAGVRHAFGLHGGHLDPILTSMVRHGISLIDTRHEAVAGNAAEGYARATGGLGVAFATAGPGFANVFPALANAYVDRIPMLLLTSSPPLREAELNVLQGGIDQIAAASAVTRWAHRVTTASRIPDLVALAIRHATAGVRGPVLLEFPIDVLSRPVDEATASTATLVEIQPPGPSAHAVALGFHLPEFDTMVRHQLPITTIVFNNQGWGMSLHGQQALYGTDTRVIVDLPDTRYDQIATAFGLYAERVERPAEIGPAMR